MSQPRSGLFGLDLGTTYSVVSYIDETGRAAVTRNSFGESTTPSVVYFENEGNVVVGKVAKESTGIYPDKVVSLIKREMGDREWRRTFFDVEYTPASISALILGALIKDAEADTGRSASEVVITVPAYFGLLEKDATRQAGEIAGLKVIGIVPEPVAAAMHYGVTGSADGTTFLVYDLGGGTFDISLIRMTEDSVEVLAVGGDHRLGGTDWDEKLFEYIVDQAVEQCGDDSLRDDEAMLQELHTVAERIKKDLSTAETKTVIIRYTTAIKITVTREQFEDMTAELLDDTIRITTRMLDEAEQRYPGIRGQISELLLVGGSTRMPAVGERLKREFSWVPRLTDPDLAVAKGAALYAADQSVRHVEGAAVNEGQIRSLTERKVVNVLPKAVGIKLLNVDKPNWEADPDSASYIEHLIPAQTQLPCADQTFVANTVTVNQPAIAIEIWEQSGAVPDPELAANHRVDDVGLIEGLAPFNLPAGSPVEIAISVDAEGTVSLVAVEPASGKELKMSVRISILSEEQIAQAKVAYAGLTVST